MVAQELLVRSLFRVVDHYSECAAFDDWRGWETRTIGREYASPLVTMTGNVSTEAGRMDFYFVKAVLRERLGCGEEAEQRLLAKS